MKSPRQSPLADAVLFTVLSMGIETALIGLVGLRIPRDNRLRAAGRPAI